MTDFSAYDIHRIDQASPEAWVDVDDLTNDRETASRLSERGQDIYAVELARDLDAQVGSRMALAGFAAMATIRRVQDRDERNELRAEIQRLRAVTEASESRIESTIAQAFDPYATQPYGDLRLNAKRAALIATAAIRDLLGEASTKVEPTEPQYLIWSHHHKAWWGANGCGYRNHIADAGRYDLADTKQWLGRICGCCVTPEVAVPAPPLVAFESPSGLAQFAKEQIKKATAAAIEAGQVNVYALCGAVGTGWPNGTEGGPVNTEPCQLRYDHAEDHDWAQREAAEEATKARPACRCDVCATTVGGCAEKTVR